MADEGKQDQKKQKVSGLVKRGVRAAALEGVIEGIKTAPFLFGAIMVWAAILAFGGLYFEEPNDEKMWYAVMGFLLYPAMDKIDNMFKKKKS